MIRRLAGYLVSWPAIFALFLVFGCSGGNSGEDAFEKTPTSETQRVAQYYDEKCALCHRTDSIADVETLHAGDEETESIDGRIDSVAVDAGTGLVTVYFELFDSANSLIPVGGMSKSNIRFTLAKLVPGTNGEPICG